MNVLVINAGSSSVKYALIRCDAGGDCVTRADGIVERIGEKGTCLRARRLEEPAVEAERQAPEVRSASDALEVIAAALTGGEAAALGSLDDVDAVGHRVVHGADVYTDATRLGGDVIETLRDISSLAPLHNPANLAGIEAAQALWPGRDHVAVFDTAFHATMPREAHLYGLPLGFARDRRIRRYGFHGTSHKYVSRRAREILGPERSRRMVTAHIGNGASLTAVLDGRSVDTTMGFTPLEGVMMGTRSGTVDPALVLHLIRGGSMTPDAVDRLLNRESGLKGMAGVGSGDLRDVLEASASGDEAATVALEVYVYRIVTAIGALTAAMGGLDALVFTAGAGENSPDLREAVCARLAYLGMTLDPERNGSAPGQGDRDIAEEASPCRVLVVHTREDEMIARETARLVGGEP